MFTTPCDIRVLKGGKVKLIAPLKFKYRGMLITILAGYIWDLASIPDGLHDIVGDPFDYVMESGVHDPLYESGLFSRDECDLIFYLLLRSGGQFKDPVNKVRAKALYAGVRMGGGSHYRTGNISAAREFVSIEMIK